MSLSNSTCMTIMVTHHFLLKQVHFQYFWSSSSSSYLYRKDVVFVFVVVVDTNLHQSEGLVPSEWAHSHGGSLSRVCTATDGRLEELWWHFLECFICLASSRPFQTFMVFKVGILATCNFFERQVRLTSQTLSIFRAAPIACQRRVVEVIGTVE